MLDECDFAMVRRLVQDGERRVHTGAVTFRLSG